MKLFATVSLSLFLSKLWGFPMSGHLVGGYFSEEQRTYQCLLRIYNVCSHKSSYAVCSTHKSSSSQGYCLFLHASLCLKKWA